MQSEEILTEGNLTLKTKDQIATIDFCHPLGNSLPSKLLSQLKSSIDEAANNKECSVIVVQSSGKSFCGGASFQELSSLKTIPDATEFFMGFAKVMLAMRASPKPVIVKVHGKSVGGALGLIAASDWAIATNDASVRLSELSIGIGPFTIGPVVVRKIGIGNFQRLSLSTDWQDATWALQAGLYQELVPSGETIDSCLEKRIKQILKLDSFAFLENKKLMWSFNDVTEESLLLKAKTVSSLLLSASTQNMLKNLTAKA